ncbi:putative signal transducing protein [Calycomorphotria hydatis]|uniref:DUF2007 domain-containing protein n=1 Tax=Calycomorphotria hydatis TaxID=2528027 RepID=A0A517T3G7_9PLAN|nr:DUF2007 domain-containing protein [Calycomorphotria hydatis]QDT62916.1 hypothetical protein V22_01140 [Calycomorphotria hydatis]
MSDSLVPVAGYISLGEAGVLQSALLEEGIPSVIDSEAGSLVPYGQMSSHRLLVNAEDLERAAATLKQARLMAELNPDISTDADESLPARTADESSALRSMLVLIGVVVLSCLCIASLVLQFYAER